MQMLSMTPSTCTPQRVSPAPPPRCLTQPAATPQVPAAVAAAERARLARELHDAVLPALFSLDLLAHSAQVQAACGDGALATTLARLRAVAGEAQRELRALLAGQSPPVLTGDGVAGALGRLVAALQVRSELPIALDARGADAVRLATAVETAVVRIVQEALSNALKYAGATGLSVTLRREAGRLVVQVSDDGVGFDPAAPVIPSAEGRRGGLGLPMMAARAAEAGLQLRVWSAPGAGTRVVVEAPLVAESDRAGRNKRAVRSAPRQI